MAAPQALHIVNSANPQALGDAISAVPAVALMGLAAQDRQEELPVWWETEAVAGLFDLPGVRQKAGSPSPDLLAHRLDIQEVARGFMHMGIPITEAWARAMGTTLPAGWCWPSMRGVEGDLDHTLIPGFKPLQPYVLFSPYSYSDNGTGNKEWPFFKWFGLVEQLQEAGLQVGMLAAASDSPLPIPGIVDFQVLGQPLPAVAAWMREAACVVTIDNGMNWLAQACEANHVLITAAAHPPAWSSNPSPAARNIPDARTASIHEVVSAALALAEGELT